jgi:hypothetical protein
VLSELGIQIDDERDPPVHTAPKGRRGQGARNASPES